MTVFPVMKGLVLALALCLGAGAAQALDVLDDAHLQAVTGQEGVMLDLELRFNANADATPMSSMANCRNTNLCNIALQFNNRPGWFTVYKDVYGSYILHDLKLNAAYTPAAASVYADNSRFLDNSGNCLLGGAANDCASRALDRPTLAMAYNDPCPEGTQNCLYSSFNPKIEYHLQIGRTAIETLPTDDANGSFMGLLLSDTQQLRAQIDISGRVYISGF